MSKKNKSKKSSKSSSRKRTPGPLTAAGLVRFYEEADVGVKIKPYTLIILMLVFTIVIIVLSKIYS
ncbi:MAG: preprotein translocase subunit Sec61beta [Desulfurococcaceae archaeon]